MNGIKVLKKPFLTIFNGICVFGAIYYTMVQINTYFDNENSSAIRFEVLTKGLDDLYPTYTICLEDSVTNDKHPMYKTRYIDTLSRETTITSVGYNETREKFADEFCPDFCSVRMEGNKMLYFNDTVKHVKDSGGRCKFYTFDDDNNYFELIQPAFMLQEEEKWYVTHPVQYPAVLMGKNDSQLYMVDCYNDIHEFDVQSPWEDFLNLDFDERLGMDLRQVLLDYETKNMSGVNLGWLNNDYKESKTYCYFESGYYNHFYGNTDGKDLGKAEYIKKNCKTPMAWREKFESRIDTTYPFDKVYQDPKKVCYSPKQDPRIFRERDTIRLNLIEMFESWYDYRDDFSDFLSIYVHPQGQFLRNLNKVAGRQSKGKMFTNCPCCKYTEEEISSSDGHRILTEFDMNYEDGTNDDNLHCTCVSLEGQLGSIPTRQKCRTTIYDYVIYQITLLKERPDSNDVCDPDLVNEDKKILEVVIDHIGCYPSFWEKLVKSRTKYGKCTKLSQYKQIAMMTSGFTRFDNFTSNYTRPCQDMTMVFNEAQHTGENVKLQIHNKDDADTLLSDLKWTEILDGRADKMCIKDAEYTWPNGTLRFDTECLWLGDGQDVRDTWHNPKHGNKHVTKKYEDKFFGPYLDIAFTISTGGKYQVIENSRAFSVENCWSGIGGFVGIFIGLSLMAVPDLIQDVYEFLKTKVFNK